MKGVSEETWSSENGDDGLNAKGKVGRWERVAIAASKQSLRSFL